MIKPVRTYVLIADAIHARVVVNEGVGKGLKDVPKLTMAGEPGHARDVYADRPGRSQDSSGLGGRHAMERPTGAEEQAHRAFAKKIGSALDRAAQRGEYDRLVLVAEPSMLGHLRGALSKTVEPRVVAEIAKDLTRQSNDELKKQLESVLAV